MKKRIYLDHAATTYMDLRVKNVMEDFFIKNFGNPSNIYYEGRLAKKAITLARKQVAKIINARPEEIIFTSGGTESDNLAVFGVVNQFEKGHIITTKFEHHAVLNPCKYLEKQGWDVTYLEVGKEGVINSKDVEKALRPDTILVSIIYANNEIGTIQPIVEIGKIIKNYKKQKLGIGNWQLEIHGKTPFFHVDACQAAPYLDLNVDRLGVGLMTISGSKIYGPKGIGFLYIKKGVKISPLMFGGEQERGLRPGTENVASIIGLAEALKIAQKEKDKESKRLIKLRDYFMARLFKEIPKTFLNGHATKRLPNNINVSILDTEGESVVLYLDEYGIACSTGSACSSTSLKPSHVIMALKKPYVYGHGSLRFTLGRSTSKKDIDYVMRVLPKIVKKLRTISAINTKV